MKISITVKPNSKQESFELKAGVYVIKVNAPPSDGLANERVIELLSKFFKKSKSSLEIIAGHKAKKKIVEVS